MSIVDLTDRCSKSRRDFIELAVMEHEGDGHLRRLNGRGADELDVAEAKKTHALLDAGEAGSFRSFWLAGLTLARPATSN